ncbi:MAG: HAD family hydrolase [Anaerolineales bacterium]|nr:HAD family hydrolase [Anaerolineales bacterium]
MMPRNASRRSIKPMQLSPALFLDRDGVIIENRADYVRSWADVSFFPQALTALARIRHCAYKIIIVTNQSPVGRGIISLETAVSINNRVIQVIRKENGRVDGSYICPDAPGSGSPCRKPKPGMLLQAAQEHNIDLSRSIMIGDALTDIQAGRAAGVAHAVMLLTGRGQSQSQKPEAAALAPIPIFADLTVVLNHFFPDGSQT